MARQILICNSKQTFSIVGCRMTEKIVAIAFS